MLGVCSCDMTRFYHEWTKVCHDLSAAQLLSLPGVVHEQGHAGTPFQADALQTMLITNALQLGLGATWDDSMESGVWSTAEASTGNSWKFSFMTSSRRRFTTSALTILNCLVPRVVCRPLRLLFLCPGCSSSKSPSSWWTCLMRTNRSIASRTTHPKTTGSLWGSWMGPQWAQAWFLPNCPREG